MSRFRWPLTRFVVRDTSMLPTLRPGDRLLVWTWASPRAGDLVVLRDPELPGLHLVKRVAACPGESLPAVGGLVGYAVLGETAAESRDSRTFGRVPPDLIVGRVVWRYLPVVRRGRVARR